MKTARCLISASLICFVSTQYAQNLVPNPSFEITSCQSEVPHGWGAEGWYNPNLGSPDLFGQETIPGCIVPYNSSYWLEFGEWQEPQDGIQMAALVSHIDATCIREYVGCKLNEPLLEDETYTASLHVALTNLSTAATDCFGFYFSQDSLAFEDVCDIGQAPTLALSAGVLLSDTLSWTELNGEFQAEGGEQYMIIGTISSNDACAFEVLYDPEETFINAKYFVDNVTVERKNDVSVEDEDSNRLLAFPNPCEDFLRIPSFKSGDSYSIWDTNGRKVDEGVLSSVRIDTRGLEIGSYVLLLESQQTNRPMAFWKR